jgi:hypothetical protein
MQMITGIGKPTTEARRRIKDRRNRASSPTSPESEKQSLNHKDTKNAKVEQLKASPIDAEIAGIGKAKPHRGDAEARRKANQVWLSRFCNTASEIPFAPWYFSK